MPYTLPLRDMPSFPAAQGKLVNVDGTPTREFVTWWRDLEEWMKAARAAFDEVEPPEALESKTVAQLPAAASNTGVRYLVTDANATTFSSIVAGGGANIVPVFSTGAAWRIG